MSIKFTFSIKLLQLLIYNILKCGTIQVAFLVLYVETECIVQSAHAVRSEPSLQCHLVMQHVQAQTENVSDSLHSFFELNFIAVF